MSIYSRNCYTYLIGWSKLNIWYYGAKYGKDANPDTFWVNYFTSSMKVYDFRKENGEPDVIQIRKTFGEDYIRCRLWEVRVLVRLCVPKNIKFLNRSTGDGKFSTAGMMAAKYTISNMKLGLVSVDDPRLLTGEISSVLFGNKGIIRNKPNKNKGIPTNTYGAKDINGISLGRVPLSDIRWETGEIVSANKGIPLTDEHKLNIKLNHHNCTGENNSFYGKTHTKESKEKIGNRDYSSISKAIILNGIEYRSEGAANRALNIPRGVIGRLLRTGTQIDEKYSIQSVRYKD